MIRYLSAIGMSRCITVKAASRLVQHFLQHPQNEPALVRDPSSGDHLVELVWSMDHFGLVLRGRISAPGQVEVHELMPAILDFAEGQRLEDWEVVSTDRRTPVRLKSRVNRHSCHFKPPSHIKKPSLSGGSFGALGQT